MDLLSSTLHVQYCFIVNITYVLSVLFRNFSFAKRKRLFHSRTHGLAMLNRRITNITFLLSFHLYIYIFFFQKVSLVVRYDRLNFQPIFCAHLNKRNVCPSFRRSRKNFVSSSARRQSDRKK